MDLRKNRYTRAHLPQDSKSRRVAGKRVGIKIQYITSKDIDFLKLKYYIENSSSWRVP